MAEQLTMRRFLAGIAIGLTLLLGGAGAHAASYMPKEIALKHFLEVGFPSKGNHKVSGGSGYSGPGDQGVTLLDCWGAQRCRAAYSGHAVNACLVSSFSTCADIDYDATTNGLNTTQLNSLCSGSCGDTLALAKILYSNYSTGCNLTAAGSTTALPILQTSTDNGHVSLGIASAAGGMTCTEGAKYTDASILRVTNMDTDFNGLAYGNVTSGVSANQIYIQYQQGPPRFTGAWQDDSSSQHASGPINYTPTTALTCLAVNAEMSASTALAQLIVGSTVASSNTTTGNATGTGNTIVNNASAASGENFIEGRQPFLAITSPHVSSANALTVMGVAKTFFVGSSC